MSIYVYDIPGMRSPKEGQLALQMRYNSNDAWGLPINYSFKISYLKSKMKAHRFDMVKSGFGMPVEYRIVDDDETEYFFYNYGQDEYDDIKMPSAPTIPKENFIRVIDENDPVGYYYVINDEEGKCITDIGLLMYLRDAVWKDRIAMASVAKPLAYISTHIPKSIDDFKAAYGFGEKLQLKYGQYFLDKIDEFKTKSIFNDSKNR